jgi:D-glycero-alpha-D-manno-heptose-7-phosphate kinase
MVIRAKAPLRISFAGGGTDVPPFPAREGGLVLNATINRYAYGTLRSRPDASITIHSYDYGSSVELSAREPPVFDGKLDLAKAAIMRFTGDGEVGFDLLLHSNAPPGSGLGASSAMMVALIGVLKEFRSIPVTDYELAELAHTIEREELGISGGRQDQYAATFGGFNFIELYGDHVVVNPLRVAPDVVLELEHNLLLCYTGTTRQSDQIIDDQMRRYESGESDATAGLLAQKELALEMKNALLQRRLDDFAALPGHRLAGEEADVAPDLQRADRRSLRGCARRWRPRRKGDRSGWRRLSPAVLPQRPQARGGGEDAGARRGRRGVRV